MDGLLTTLASAIQQMNAWEAAAVLLAIVYLLLVVRENIWCWAAAFLSTSIYLVLFYRVQLLMESALQIFYLAMAVYGWYQWRHGAPNRGELSISTWMPTQHATAITMIVLVTASSGALLDRYTSAAFPYIDSFTSWAAVLTTYMVARKILENWIYWFVIDSVSIYLYVNRGMYLTALLFMLYLVIIVIGFTRWQREYRRAKGRAHFAQQIGHTPSS